MTDAEAADLLRGAVARASVSGEEAELAAWLAATLAPHADEAGVDEAGNVVAVIGSGPVLLTSLGHIDTVPGAIPVREEAGELWGRGSVDAKGSFCTHAAGVLRAFREQPGLRDRLSVRLIGAVGEETAGSPGARHVLRHQPRPDLLLVAEPSGWQGITLGYKGSLRLRLDVTAPEAHSAAPLASACDGLLAACAAMGAEARSHGGAHSGQAAARTFDQVQVSVRELGSSSDGLRQRAGALVAVRLPPGVTPDAARAALAAAAGRAVAGLEGVELAVRAAGGEEAVLAPRDSPLSRAFRHAIRQAGGRPVFKLKTGTSDMNVVAPHWNVPMLAYGPGDSALDHTPEERLGLGEYSRAVAVVAAALRDLGSGYRPERS